MKSILDPGFKYIPSVNTDIRKTFDRIRREQAKKTEIKRVQDTGRTLDTQRIVDIFEARRKDE